MEGFFFAVPLGTEDDGCDAVFGSSRSSLQMSQPASWAQPSSTTFPIVNNQLTPFMNATQGLNTTAWDTGYLNNARQSGMAMLFSPFQRQVPNAPVSLHPHSISMNTTSPDQGRSYSLKRLRESTENLPLYPQSGDGQPPAKKRAPKAPKMDANKWAPAETRIRQLFVDDGLPYNELRNIINKEFGFSATERQYKTKISQMKLKRNVEERKRKSIVRHIQYRKEVLRKATNHVRVYGHLKTDDIQRWMQQYPTTSRRFHGPPPSPLQSQISLRTGSRIASARSSVLSVFNPGTVRILSSTIQSPKVTPVDRLLEHAHRGNVVIDSKQCGNLLNDFQQLLSAGNDVPKCPKHDIWSPDLEHDLFKIRNQLNLTRELNLAKYAEEWIRYSKHAYVKDSQLADYRYGRWRTPYGTVTALFWRSQTYLENDRLDVRSETQTIIGAQIAINSRGSSGTYRTILDLDLCLNPSTSITYQATRPNDSEIFSIVRYGKLEELLKVLEEKTEKTAGLTDRDEEGRSLLNYAKFYGRVDFLRFLLKHNFDPDACELDLQIGDLRPMYYIQLYNSCELPRETAEEEWYYRNRSECFKALLEAGADFEKEESSEDHTSGMRMTLITEDSMTLKHVINHGEPFIHPSILVREYRFGELVSPLLFLASISDYSTSGVVMVLEKAILLLNWGVDISCCDRLGNTVLHRILDNRCLRAEGRHGIRPYKEPGELLKVFIAAGADVYALNNAGRSASRTAANYGREEEWSEALESCGFNSKEIVRQTMPRYLQYTGPRQVSKLTFKEYCRTWDEDKWAEEMGTGRFWWLDSEAEEEQTESEEEREEGSLKEDRTYSEYDFDEDEDDSEYEWQECLRQREEYTDDEVSEEEAQEERSACCCDQVLSAIANSITDGGDGYDTVARSGDGDGGTGSIFNEIGTREALSVDTQDHANSMAINAADVLKAMSHNGNAVAASIGSSYDQPCHQQHAELEDTTVEYFPASTQSHGCAYNPAVSSIPEYQYSNDDLGTLSRDYDPMFNVEAESTNGTWRYDATDPRETFETNSLSQADFFEMDTTLGGTLHTDWDIYMADDEGV